MSDCLVQTLLWCVIGAFWGTAFGYFCFRKKLLSRIRREHEDLLVELQKLGEHHGKQSN